MVGLPSQALAAATRGWCAMSTWFYLVCEKHGQAEDESGQHHYDLPTIRFNWLHREHWLSYIDRFPSALGREFDHLSYFERHTFSFLREHRDCGVPHIRSEYGDRFPIEVSTVEALMATYDSEPLAPVGGE